MYRYIIIAAIMLAAPGLRAQDDDMADPYFLLMGEADSALAAGHWPEAAARLNEAMAVRPDAPTNALLLSNLGEAYAAMGCDSLAADAFDRGLAIAPKMGTLWVGRGRNHMFNGRIARAIADLDHAVQLDSCNVSARVLRGHARQAAGDPSGAVADWLAAEALVPDDCDNLYCLGCALLRAGRPADAATRLARVVRQASSPLAYSLLGECYIRTGMLAEAADVLDEGRGKYPDAPEIYVAMAALEQARFCPDRAREYMRRATELHLVPQ